MRSWKFSVLDACGASVASVLQICTPVAAAQPITAGFTNSKPAAKLKFNRTLLKVVLAEGLLNTKV